MKISELAEAPLPADEALIAYDFVDGQPSRHMPIGEYLRRHKPIYTHRNGETETPTEAGEYWFSGHHNNTHEMQEMLRVCLEKWDTEIEVFACDELFYIQEFSGRWWGPIIPPWENK